MRLLWRLLRKNISAPQIIGFSLANLLGVVVLLLGAQFFSDSHSVFTQSDSFMKGDFIIISKEVSTVGSLLGGTNSFDQAEIDDIESQPFVRGVGRFNSSHFRIYASLDIAGRGISSDIFFESVPDRYVDVDTKEWHYEEGDINIPIIIPRNYLNLYNFGFSQSRGLPKLTEEAISLVGFDIKIRGAGGYDTFHGRIVGFSNRLNTILVPESFMSWANSTYDPSGGQESTRLIVEVENSADKELLAFFKNRGYDVEGNALEGGEMVFFARIITFVVLLIGLVVTLLSVYILILSLFLLLEKNSTKIETLILMGYSPWQIIAPYSGLISLVNLAIIGVSISTSLWLRSFYVDILAGIYPLDSVSASATYYVGVALYVAIALINLVIIRGKIYSIIKRRA